VKFLQPNTFYSRYREKKEEEEEEEEKRKNERDLGGAGMESNFVTSTGFYSKLYGQAINSICVKWGKLYKHLSVILHTHSINSVLTVGLAAKMKVLVSDLFVYCAL
jgi:hypothetical protein